MTKDSIDLPKKRGSVTYELIVHCPTTGRFKLYLAVGVDDAGRPIEIWLDCMKEGTMLRELMHAWAALFSIALQHRVPMWRLVHLYKEWTFDPSGTVEGLEGIKSCTSIPSLVVSVLEKEFPGQMPKGEGQAELWK